MTSCETVRAAMRDRDAAAGTRSSWLRTGHRPHDSESRTHVRFHSATARADVPLRGEVEARATARPTAHAPRPPTPPASASQPCSEFTQTHCNPDNLRCIPSPINYIYRYTTPVTAVDSHVVYIRLSLRLSTTRSEPRYMHMYMLHVSLEETDADATTRHTHTSCAHCH